MQSWNPGINLLGSGLSCLGSRPKIRQEEKYHERAIYEWESYCYLIFADKRMKTMVNKKEKNLEDISIWVVEDNIHFRQTMKNLLNQSEEFDCGFAFASCEDALAEMKNTVELPAIILLDIGLEGMSGIEGIKKFKELSPATHIVMLTIYDDKDSVFEALCAGASGYLLKSSPPEKVIEAIKEVLEGGAPMDMHIARKVIEMFKQLSPPKGDYGLTAREKEILNLLVTGMNKRQIAEELFVSFHTINTHIKNIYEKLHVNTRGGLVAKAFREKLI